MNDFAFVRSTQLGSQVAGRSAEQSGQLGRVVVDEAAGDSTARFVDKVDRVAGGELAFDLGDAGRQQ